MTTGAVVAQKVNAFAHLPHKTFDGGLCGGDISPQFRRPGNHVPALAHSQVKQERYQIGREVDQQYSAQADVVIDKADNGPGDQPPSLNPRQQKGVGVDELFSRRQFLNQRSDRWPEHPEARRYQRVHQVEFPDFYLAGKCQDRNRQDDDGAERIQHHDQPAAVFAVNQNSGEGKHQHGGKGLQNGKSPQRHFRVSGLQDVPGNGGGIHAAAQHGDHVGREHVSQRPLLQDVAHPFNVNDRERLANARELAMRIQGLLVGCARDLQSTKESHSNAEAEINISFSLLKSETGKYK